MAEYKTRALLTREGVGIMGNDGVTYYMEPLEHGGVRVYSMEPKAALTAVQPGGFPHVVHVKQERS